MDVIEVIHNEVTFLVCDVVVLVLINGGIYPYFLHIVYAGILLSHPEVGYFFSHPLLRLRQCYPTLPNYFLWQQQQKFGSINYHNFLNKGQSLQ